ncbi:MAG: hypothetical protein ABIR84_10385 [Candidatus Nitrotoga sp.]
MAGATARYIRTISSLDINPHKAEFLNLLLEINGEKDAPTTASTHSETSSSSTPCDAGLHSFQPTLPSYPAAPAVFDEPHRVE